MMTTKMKKIRQRECWDRGGDPLRLGQQKESLAFECHLMPGWVFQKDEGISFIRNLLEPNIPTVLFLEVPI